MNILSKDKDNMNAHEHQNIRWTLFTYDVILYFAVSFVLLILYDGSGVLTTKDIVLHTAVSFCALFAFRFIFHLYQLVWRYGGIQCYIRILLSDGCAFLVYLFFNYLILPIAISFTHVLSIISVNCLAVLSVRMLYRYIYKTGRFGALLNIFSLGKVQVNVRAADRKIKIAIVGAGSIGVNLSEELINNPNSAYVPCCFIESDHLKIGREIHNIPIIAEDANTFEKLNNFEVQEIVLAVPQMDVSEKKALYEYYRGAGYAVKVYDFPTMEAAGGKRTLRDFDIEELLFRKPLAVTDEKTVAYYEGKTVMITGGGGSIGSELCRQIAKMRPKQLIILDVYENGAYDVQQELKMRYGTALNLKVVIVSVCNKKGLERAFKTYRPQILIHAAAHKHVPFMEDDCIEAVENNVFGTKNTVELAEKYGAERFIMVSTDKAVNPTNVMGATKRMCEMIVLNHQGRMTCSATRFGNVLGSAGSVIPLFKRQIAAGGPVTVTDKRIIRYFMTIPEAAGLVLQSGAMAKDKELFVLDMGEPVKILDLAENMIRLSGQSNIEIIETGLRPGEKLYEELLVKTEELDKTENELIFIEHDKPLAPGEIEDKLQNIMCAVESDDNTQVREAMRKAVPTYRRPEEVNREAAEKEKI